MRRFKKGFTLIELLAVIVILAVIATVATPIIMSNIDKAFKASLQNSAYSYVQAIEYYVARAHGDDDTTNDQYFDGAFNDTNLEIRGTRPTSVDVVVSQGVVKSGFIVYEDYSVVIGDGKVIDIVVSDLVLKISGSKEYTIEVNSSFTVPTATATDTVDGDLTSAIEVTNKLNKSVVGIYAITYKVKNSIGMVATDAVIVKVVDTLKPVITILGDNPLTHEAGQPYTDGGATALDSYDGDITAQIQMASNVVPGIYGSYKVTYIVTDSSGNEERVERIVKVVDTTFPTVAYSPNGNNTYEGSHSTAVTVSDSAELNTNSLKYIWTTSTTAPSEDDFTQSFVNGDTIDSPAGANGDYYLWVLAKDSAANTSILSSKVFKMDNGDPAIAFGTNGNSTYKKQHSTSVTVTDLGAGVDTTSLEYIWTTSSTAPSEASFLTSFTNGSSLTTPASVNGTYYLWILAKDRIGNTSIIRSSAFNLDNAEPSIVFVTNGNTAYKQSNSTVVNITDTNSGVIANTLKYQWTTTTATPTEASFSTVFTSGAVINTPASSNGTYYLWVRVEDNAGNINLQRSNVFNLDSTYPTITINGSSPYEIVIGGTYTDPGYTASDNIDTSLTIEVSTVSTSTSGTYTQTYKATDDAGNATTTTRTIYVWSAWSGWSTTAVDATATKQVETYLQYSYRDYVQTGTVYKSCADSSCGIASTTYKSCANSACGVASYNSCQSSDCGQTCWNNTCRTSACGCETYKSCANSACGTYCNTCQYISSTYCKSCSVFSSCKSCANSACGCNYYSGTRCVSYKSCANCTACGSNYTTITNCSTCGTGNNYTTAANCSACGSSNSTCRTSACGCETYKSCSNSACGQSCSNNTCATAACGVSSYNSCRTSACGVDYYTYNSCKATACGVDYYTYAWNAWSAYSDTVATATATKEVRTQTMYRYRTR